jgi:uncharacterized protein (TIGR03435 family)
MHLIESLRMPSHTIATLFSSGVLLLGLPCYLLAQAPQESLSFDVASIRPTQSRQASIDRSGNRLTVAGYTPRMLIQWAYDLRDDQLVGQSKALDATRFDVVAQTAEQPPRGGLQRMMQSLLKERFGLVTHPEQRNLTFFAMTVDDKGLKVTPSQPEPGPSKNEFSMPSQGNLRGAKVTTAMLANVLSNQTGRIVRDLTGVQGSFDFAITFAPDALAGTAAANGAPSIFTAIREQLGLKLESRKGPVDVLVVDQVQGQPSDN